MKEGKQRNREKLISALLGIVMALVIVPVMSGIGILGGQVFADTGDVVNDWQGEINGIKWKIIETTEGQELRLEQGSQESGSNVNIDDFAGSGGGTESVHESKTEAEKWDANIEKQRSKWPWLAEGKAAGITSIKVMEPIAIKGSMAYMFSVMPELTKIEGFELLDVSEVTSMYCLFGHWNFTEARRVGCSKLTSLNVSTWNVEKVVNLSNLFCGCSSLVDLNLSTWNPTSAEILTGMFGACSSLTGVNFGEGIEFPNATTTRSMFQGCSSMTTIDLSKMNFSDKLENTGQMFKECAGLQSFTWPANINTANVENAEDMFWGCTSLETLDLSKYSTDSLRLMADMFRDCSTLEELNLSNFDTSNVTKIKGFIQGCTSLTSLNLGDRFTTKGVKDMSFMFSEWTESQSQVLDTVLSKLDTSSATTMQGMFKNCKACKTLTLGEKFDTSNVTNMFEMFSGCTKLTSLNLGDNFDTSKCTVSMRRMFNGCSELANLALGDNFDTSNVVGMRYMFNGCTKLETIDLGDKFDTSNVEDMNEMFSECSSLKELKLGEKFNTGKVKNMYRMFYGCSALKTLNLGTKFDTRSVGLPEDSEPSNDKDHENDPKSYRPKNGMSGMFNGCSSLEELKLGDMFDTGKVPNMKNMFNGCKKLNELDLGDRFYTGEVETMQAMFKDCCELTTLDLGDMFDTSHVEDTYRMFEGCNKLKQLELVNLDTLNVGRAALMFNGCSALESTGMLGFEFDNIGKIGSANNIIKGCGTILTALNGEATGTLEGYDSNTAGKLADAKAALEKLMEKSPLPEGDTLKNALKEISDYYVYKTAQDNITNTNKAIKTARDKETAAQEARADADLTLDPDDRLKMKKAAREADNAVGYAINQYALAMRNIKRAKLPGGEDMLDDDVLDGIKDDRYKRHEREKAEEEAEKAVEEARKAIEKAKADTEAALEAVDTVKDGKTEEDLAKAQGALTTVKDALAALNETKNALNALLEKATANTYEEKILKDVLSEVNEQIGKTEEAAGYIDAIAKKIEKNLSSNEGGDNTGTTNPPALLIEEGKIYVVAKNSYKVVKVAQDNTNGIVTFVKAKNAKKISIPKIVKLEDGRIYTVNGVGAKAFSAKKIRKVTVGANVTKLDKNAFSKSKVKTVVLKTKGLKKATVKGCLKGSKVKTVQVKVGGKKVNKKYVKKYKKIFTKKNAGKKVTVK